MHTGSRAEDLTQNRATHSQVLNQHKLGSNSSCDGGMKKQKSVWIEQLSQWDAALEDSAIDLDIFDMPFLETRHYSSIGAGSWLLAFWRFGMPFSVMCAYCEPFQQFQYATAGQRHATVTRARSGLLQGQCAIGVAHCELSVGIY